MFKLVEKKIRVNTSNVLKRAKSAGTKPRDAAMELAKERVLEAMRKKGRI